MAVHIRDVDRLGVSFEDTETGRWLPANPYGDHYTLLLHWRPADWPWLVARLLGRIADAWRVLRGRGVVVYWPEHERK